MNPDSQPFEDQVLEGLLQTVVEEQHEHSLLDFTGSLHDDLDDVFEVLFTKGHFHLVQVGPLQEGEEELDRASTIAVRSN